MAYDNGRELGWNDEIQKDSEFVLLENGDYPFEVVKYERARHAGSAKIPPCNKAIVHLRFTSPEGSTLVQHNLYLHSSMEWAMCAFFTAVGMRKHGERMKIDLDGAIGRKGWATLYIDEWEGNNGPMKSNRVKQFIDPKDAPAPSAPSAPGAFRPGEF